MSRELPSDASANASFGDAIGGAAPRTLCRNAAERSTNRSRIFERALGGELTHHLGYEEGETKPAGSANHRNGSSRKPLTTDDDTLELNSARS